MSTRDGAPGAFSGWRLVAAWAATEAAVWALFATLGTVGSVWFMAVSLLVGVLFAMVWGSICVLRGHDL